MQEYTVKIDSYGDKYWYKPGTDICHRLDGPAVEYSDGDKEWFQNGKLHRLDGPAAELANGTKFWYQNDKLHRLDGPAIEYANGSKSWYIDDVEYTKEEFNAKVNPTAKEITVAEISELLGFEVKIIKS